MCMDYFEYANTQDHSWQTLVTNLYSAYKQCKKQWVSLKPLFASAPALTCSQQEEMAEEKKKQGKSWFG